MTNLLYVYPKLSAYDFYLFRLFGGGLGNLLFPWARAQLAARRLGCEFVEPTWPQVKIGTFVRREPDLRFYKGLFEPEEKSVVGLERIRLLLTRNRISEAEYECEKFINWDRDLVVEFSGLGRYFEPLIGHACFIKEKLVAITKKKHLNALSHDFSESITVHVRLGDFAIGNLTTPISWYIRAISSLRRKIDKSWRVWVFSDGADEQLRELLSLPNVARLGFGSSIADMLAMSKSRILLGGRHSTFSRWAAFLGEMPSIWPQEPLRLRCQKNGLELESQDGYLSDNDVDYLVRTMKLSSGKFLC